MAMAISTPLKGGQLHGNGISSSTTDAKTLSEQQSVLKGTPPNILHVLDRQGIRPDSATYASLLQGCLNMKSLPEGKLIHARILQDGFKPDIYVGTKLVIMYAKCGSLLDARRVLDAMPARNVVSWTAMIASYARYGYGEDALTLLYQMQRTGVRPNQFTFASVLPACACLASLTHGNEIHEQIIRNGFQYDAFVGGALLEMYIKCGSLENACKVFDKMPERNVISWNMMIAGYAQNGRLDKALKLFEKMPEPDVVSWNAMIAGYAQSGRFGEAVKLFWQMPKRDVISWNAMIAGCAQSGDVDEALKLFQATPERDVITWNAMITGYVQNGYVDKALKLFQKMPNRDVVSWNAMTAGYAQNGHADEALKLFGQMLLTGK